MSSKPTLYNKKHNLIFFNIPKNAMTVINTEFEGGCDWAPRNKIPEDAKIFCVLRNPFDRFLSSYFHLCKIKRDKERPLTPAVKEKIFKLNIDSAKLFLDEIFANGFFDGHHIPQLWHIGQWYNENEKSGNHNRMARNLEAVDHFLDFHSLDAELSKLTGNKIKLPRLGGRTNNSPKIIKYFETRKEEIKLLYKMDYDLIQSKLGK